MRLRELTSLPDLSALIDCCGSAIVLALKDVSVALLAACFPLPSLSLVFCYESDTEGGPDVGSALVTLLLGSHPTTA